MNRKNKEAIKIIKVENNRPGIEKLEKIAENNEILKVKNIEKMLEATIRK